MFEHEASNSFLGTPQMLTHEKHVWSLFCMKFDDIKYTKKDIYLSSAWLILLIKGIYILIIWIGKCCFI